ncbi:hypothetical protein HYFRA_00002031 [Hymenoscyphus fraxineus]|uniref:DUF7726 domain-containing protein n=1 Tax=Hymenoscyphus fraxineus TaxID=746836 RepID=A0A9N9PMG2_9HELO|nr:hypothetical protein HYFRA_00002031 [Hymenoscyphus fraxineus]
MPAKKKVLSEKTSNTLNADAPITEIQMSTAAKKMFTEKGIDIPTATEFSSKKRKISDCEEISIDDERCYDVDISCDAVRNKIRKYLETGEMTVGQFKKAIDVNTAPYNNFMQQAGAHKGEQSSVYPKAFAFFKHRELNGIKPPKKPKVVKEAAKAKEEEYDVTDCEKLEGETENAVKVYDTCDVARKHINELINKQHVSKAFLMNQFKACFSDDRKISASQFTAFLSKKGPNAGNRAAVFYAAYVYFEKLRIKQDKPKTGFREEMEKKHKRGFDLETNHDKGYKIHISQRVVVNQYGEVRIEKR